MVQIDKGSRDQRRTARAHIHLLTAVEQLRCDGIEVGDLDHLAEVDVRAAHQLRTELMVILGRRLDRSAAFAHS